MKDSVWSADLQVPKHGERAKQERSLQTRSELLKAARKVFVRDGFERARLEDIAEAAGKTRGAFYAHFEDKEDVFFAIFEEDVARSQRELADGLNPGSSREARFEALVAHFKSKICEGDQMLLSLEFKMYALRNPQGSERFTALQTALCLESRYFDYRTLLPEFASAGDTARRQIARISALIDGLALNRLLNPTGLDDEALDRGVRTGVRAILFDAA
ncbi:MAG: TetR/AcrR family transcriptional regulator [Acidobacteriota bacterium]|nr:TetR/AcrR family transcriptional regulator [Acidobacteriota bacterium]